MKTLLATAALVVVVSTGSPATAQVYGDRWNDQASRAFAQAEGPVTVQQRRNLARAQRPDGQFHSSNPNNDVYTQGRYVGSDPDPFIRNELARVPPDRDE